MYLAGSSEKPESLNCVQVYNTKTLGSQIFLKTTKFKLRNLEGTIYMKSDEDCLIFKTKDRTMEVVELDTDSDICMIANICYLYLAPGEFIWKTFETNGEDFRRLEGLEGLPKFAYNTSVKLVNYGGKLMVLWDKYVRASGLKKKKMIWCAEISLEMRNDEEIWGRFDAVLTVLNPYKFVGAVAATV